MFLNQLERKNKEAFLKICVLAALSNGVFAQEEKEMIGAYCREMNIPENIPDCSETLEDVLKELAISTSNKEKNIILLEILGLVKSDGIYDEKEVDFMEKLSKGLDVKEGTLTKLNALLEIYTVVYKEIYLAIND